MRRTIAIISILLANLAMLAHGVVPHHRHSSLLAAAVHILDYGAQAEAADTDHLATPHRHHGDPQPCDARHGDHHHAGDHHEGDEDCRVEETCIATFTLREDDDVRPDAAAAALSLPIDGALGASAVTLSPCGASTPWLHKPYVEARRTALMVRSAGLRAPPTC